MAVTARTWVEGEIASAAKFNTIRDDLLELDAVAGFFDSQYGTVTITPGNVTGDATVSFMSARAHLTMNGFSTDANSANLPGSFTRITRLNSTTIRATRASSNDTVIAAFCVSDPRG